MDRDEERKREIYKRKEKDTVDPRSSTDAATRARARTRERAYIRGVN